MQPIRNLLARKRSAVVKVMAAIALSTIASASVSKASLITSGSVFDLSIWGFTGPGGTGASQMVVGPITGIFGNTNTYSGVVSGSSQVVTVTSGETYTAGTYYDTITISVPTNFDAADLSISGSPIKGLFFDLGEAVEATAGPTTQNGLLLNHAIDPATQFAYGSAFSTISGSTPVSPVSSFNGGFTEEYAYAGVQTAGSDIAANGFNSFTFTTAVPEPVSMGTMGVIAGTALLRRRRRA